MHILTIVLMALNVLALGAWAVVTFGAPNPELVEQAARFVVIPALVGLIGVARRSAWGRGGWWGEPGHII